MPFPSLGDLPDPGIEPVSPTLQADALLSETPGMPTDSKNHHYFISPWGSLACTAVHWGRKEPDTAEMLNTTRQRSNHDSSQKVPLREPRSSNFKWKEAVEAFKLRKYKNRFKACVHAKLLQSCPTLWHPMDCNPRFLCPLNSPGTKTGVGCHFLLQGIFPTQGWNPHLSHWQARSLLPSHRGSQI